MDNTASNHASNADTFETAVDRQRQVRTLLLAVAVLFVMMATLAGTLAYQDHQVNRIETQIVQPILNAACQPSSDKTFANEKGTTPLAAYMLIKNPGQFKDICYALNKSLAVRDPSLRDYDPQHSPTPHRLSSPENSACVLTHSAVKFTTPWL